MALIAAAIALLACLVSALPRANAQAAPGAGRDTQAAPEAAPAPGVAAAQPAAAAAPDAAVAGSSTPPSTTAATAPAASGAAPAASDSQPSAAVTQPAVSAPPAAPALAPARATPPPAAAEESSAQLAERYRLETEAELATKQKPSYGWQILAVDLAGIAAGVAVAASVESEATPLGLFTATWYGVSVVGAPAVHHAHRRWPLGFGDLGMRTLMPPLIGLTGLLATCTIEEEFDDDCTRTGWSGGMLLGLTAAAAFDALLLSSLDAGSAPAPSGEWYGLQTLSIDVLSYLVGGFFALRSQRGTETHRDPVLTIWAMNYLVATLGVPIVHMVHGNVGLGFASLGMRLVINPMGAVVGMLGVCAATAGADDCAGDGARWGLLGGSLAVALFDTLVFARERGDRVRADSDLKLTIGAGSIAVRGFF